MSDLITHLGYDFFNRRFQGSFFTDDKGRPSIVGHADGSAVFYRAIGGTSKRLTATTQSLPKAFFTGLEIFSVPKLGWRSAASGKYLAFYSRNNKSYHRGLSSANLVVENSDLTKWLTRSKNFTLELSEDKKCLVALKPEFIPFTEGIAKMREGSLLSFAASATVAVVPAANDKFSIYFRQTKAGEVLPDGSVVVDIPMLNEYVEELA